MWAELGIAPGSDRDAIRRAYARKLRVTNPEDDAEGFKRLREAYEKALSQADFAARWGDDCVEEDEDDSFEPAEPMAFADELPRPDPSLFWNEPATAPLGEEARALLAGRDTDLAALRAKMADLDGALRGAWRAPDAEMEALFAQILAAPALGEIAVRGDVERWAARLIADTIPRSDAILAQAVTAFGWNEGHDHRGDYAVDEVLGRLEEWRLIAALGRPAHTLHPAWTSLTRKPARQPFWRLKTMAPGLARGVRALLCDFGNISPGLHFSFDAGSVDRWRAFFAKPRLSGIMVMLAFAVWIGVHVALGTIPQFGGRVPYALGAAVGLLSLAAPAAALQVERRRHARERAGKPASVLLQLGWAPAFAALCLAAILLPASGWAAMLVTLLGLVVLGWIAVAPDPLAHTPAAPALGRWAIGGWAYGIIGLFVGGTLTPPLQAMLGVAVVLSIAVRATMIEQVRQRLDLVAPARPWLLAGGVLLVTAMLGGLATVARVALYRGGQVDLFVGTALTLLVVVPGLAVFGPRYARWTAAAHTAALVAFATVALPLMPDVPPTARPVVVAPSGAPIPLTRDLDQAAALKQVPVLARMRDTNPVTYAAIQHLIAQRTRGDISDHTMRVGIDAAIDTAYKARLPDATARLLAEDRRIVLAQFRELRAVSPAACARGDLATLRTVSEPLRQRTDRFIQDVAATPPATAAERKAGYPIDMAKWTAQAARIAGRSVPDFVAVLDSKADTKAVCDARIAMMQAMVAHREADVAATMRALRKKKAVPRQD